MVQAFLIVGVIAIALLTWSLLRRFADDSLQQFTNRRRDSSRLVSRGEFVDGNRHLPVALALSPSAFYYENAGMQASVDLELIEEIEYENELSTGHTVGEGRVLRLRCFSQTFEFILPDETLAQWKSVLPAQRHQAAGKVMSGELLGRTA